MRVTLMVDASYCHDTNAAGYGFWVASNRGHRPGSGAMRVHVSNALEAEMMAICNALYRSFKFNYIQAGDTVLVQTDCLGAIDRFTGNNRVKSEMERKALIVLNSIAKSNDLRVNFRHVKAHTRRKENRYRANNHCDTAAKKAMRKARERTRREKAISA